MDLIDNVIPLARNLFWVSAPGKGKFPFCNSFLITGRDTVLIDAGINEKTIREIDRQRRIDALLITHSHPDHILNWHVLKDRRIIMPAETPDVITDLIQLGIRFTGSEENAYHWRKRVADELGLQPMRLPDDRFKDGDMIDTGGYRLQAIHAPGHLDDHYCFLFEGAVLLTTDIDFSSFGPWYGNPESDIVQFKKSIEKVRSIPFHLACSSHKSPVQVKDAPQAFSDYLAGFDRHAKLIWDQCETPISLAELIQVSPIYRNKMPNLTVQRIFEGAMMKKQLDLMVQEGQVEKNGETYRSLKES